MDKKTTRDQKIMEIVRRLHARTRQGAVNWEKTMTQGVVQARLAGYAVRLYRAEELPPEAEGETCEPMYKVSVYSPGGELLEQTTLGGLGVDSGRTDRIRELYETALDLASGVDKALEAILAELA
ncbi:MAG: hypothetical protein AB7D57_00660 [Desulfovibrionaceae bacterium]